MYIYFNCLSHTLFDDQINELKTILTTYTSHIQKNIKI